MEIKIMTKKETTLEERNAFAQYKLECHLENMFLSKHDDTYHPLKEKLIDLNYVLHEKERSGALCAEIFWGSDNFFNIYYEPNVLFQYWRIYLKKMHVSDFTEERKLNIKQRLKHFNASEEMVEFTKIVFDEIRNEKNT
jgi:hypothetical protein